MQRYDIELVLVCLVLGPPLAGAIYLTLGQLVEQGPSGLTSIDFGLIGGALIFFYLLAGPPMLIAAIASAVLARFLHTNALRLLAALPAGAVPFAILLGWLADAEPPLPRDLGMLAVVALSGAFTLVICVSLVETFGKPLRPRS
jgi:hypothetical protein